MTNEDNIVTEVKNAVTDNSESIDKKAPGTSFGIVALSYLGVLAVTCGVIGFVIWVSR
ncbi:hypothetical protein [Neorhodopirellula pilleata]|uniref:Uncharacterized protein n=1 Tax=Neorhodopirellula pilleata TaxID=2714738 RepID=A0A5C6AQA7_9BACT|nr:hypothetical protein [Neorhodopirellula pilleata]TWU01738.1 hypothetical protein Pla100_14730 [Neorhodopirellula pilleata]